MQHAYSSRVDDTFVTLNDYATTDVWTQSCSVSYVPRRVGRQRETNALFKLRINI